MKKIEATPIWHNGQMKNAEYLDVRITNIILGSSASFNFSLYTKQETILEEGIGQGEILISGALEMNGQEYANWGSDDDYVWIWSADKLNLTLVPNN